MTVILVLKQVVLLTNILYSMRTPNKMQDTYSTKWFSGSDNIAMYISKWTIPR